MEEKQLILELHAANMASESVQSRKRTRICEYSDINKALHEWYLLVCSKNIYPVGSQLRKKAKQIQQNVFKRQNSRHLMAGLIDGRNSIT